MIALEIPFQDTVAKFPLLKSQDSISTDGNRPMFGKS